MMLIGCGSRCYRHVNSLSSERSTKCIAGGAALSSMQARVVAIGPRPKLAAFIPAALGDGAEWGSVTVVEAAVGRNAGSATR